MSSGRRRRVAAIISSLGTGGAERVMTLLANAWAARGDDVTLVTLDDAEPFYRLDPSVRRSSLAVMGQSAGLVERAGNTLRRVRALRRALRSAEPDVCVSFIDRTNVLVLAAARGLGVPVIVSERIHPGHLDPAWWGPVRAVAYASADAVVAQTEATAGVLRRPWSAPVLTIPNPVTDPGELTRTGGGRLVAAAGRLVAQKGFDLLLRAFARATRERPSWSLIVWGEGPERARLEALAVELGVAERARFAGITNDLPCELARADLFVLPSRFEGFPNALCEAMMVGLPVVSYRCPSGPEEIIEHERDGLLVDPEDVEGLSRALARLIDDTSLRDRLGQQARRSVRERLGLSRVLQQWDDAFRRVGA